MKGKQERNWTIPPVSLHAVRRHPGTASAAPDVFGPAAFAAVSRDRRLVWARAVLSNRPRLIKGIRDFPSALSLPLGFTVELSGQIGFQDVNGGFGVPCQDPRTLFSFRALSSRLVLNVACFPRDVHVAQCHLMLLYLLLLVFILYECYFSLC